MKLRVVAVVACAVALCSMLVGCARLDTSKFIGTWELSSTNIADLDDASLELAKELGSDMELTLNEDGTGTLHLFDHWSTISWKAETETQGTMTIDDQEATVNVGDSDLSLDTADGQSMRFSKK